MSQGFPLASKFPHLPIRSGPQSILPPEFSGQGQVTYQTQRGQGNVLPPSLDSWDQGVSREQLLSLLTREAEASAEATEAEAETEAEVVSETENVSGTEDVA